MPGGYGPFDVPGHDVPVFRCETDFFRRECSQRLSRTRAPRPKNIFEVLTREYRMQTNGDVPGIREVAGVLPLTGNCARV
jgi:hypothetical protein